MVAFAGTPGVSSGGSIGPILRVAYTPETAQESPALYICRLRVLPRESPRVEEPEILISGCTREACQAYVGISIILGYMSLEIGELSLVKLLLDIPATSVL